MSGIEYISSAQRVSAMLAHDPFYSPVESFPAPTCWTYPSFASETLGTLAPAPVMKLAEFAREHSWEVRIQFSQGHFPHGTTGKPGALKDVVGVRFGAHPMTDRQAYAIYARTASDRGGKGVWSWESFMVWGPDLPPAKLYLLAELQAFLLEGPGSDAEALKSAIGDFKTIHENGKALAKQRAKSRPAKPKEGAR